MKLKNFILLVVSLGLFMGSFLDAGHHKSHKKQCVTCDPIVGVYSTVFSAFGIYGNLVFNADGTWTGQLTNNLKQPVEGFNPCGDLGTITTGTWKKIGCRTYHLFSTNVSTSNQGEGEGCCCPTTPIWRSKYEATLELSEDGNSGISNDGMFSLWSVDDLTLDTTNIVPPFSVGPVILERVGAKPCSHR